MDERVDVDGSKREVVKDNMTEKYNNIVEW